MFVRFERTKTVINHYDVMFGMSKSGLSWGFLQNLNVGLTPMP